MQQGLLGLLGGVLFTAGCTLFVMVSQTAMHADVLVGLAPGGGTTYRTTTPEDPTYPLAQQMGQLWRPEALVYVNLYLSVLAVCVGVTLVLISISGPGSRDDTKPSRSGRASWVALLIALLVGVVLANASGQAFPPLDPCWGVLGCPPWNPGTFRPPLWTLLQTYPLVSLVLLVVSLVLSAVGSFLARRMHGERSLALVRGLQLAPVMVATLMGLAALFLFAMPYQV